MRARRLFPIVVTVSMLLLGARAGLAQEPARGANPAGGIEETSLATSPVVIDGRTLFRLRGIPSYPAAHRAAAVAGRIRDLARDLSFDPDTLEVSRGEQLTWIGPKDRRIMSVTDADVIVEGVDRDALAEMYRTKIRGAITSYRATRTREALLASTWRAGVATVLAALSLLVLRWLLSLLDRWERRYADRVKGVSIRSFEMVNAARVMSLVRRALRLLVVLPIVALIVLYLEYALGLFPWTRGAATQIQEWVLAPLGVLGRGLVGMIPNLVFLAILYVVTRYALRLIRHFFTAVGRGEVHLKNFDPEWADATYNLVRLAVVMCALVVAYPYIPGASSAAFKGVSIFAAAMFSLGSTSVIGNVIAGYTMVYRRAFRVGDVIKVAGVVGIVSEIRLLVTHLRTIKNEEVVVPNSTILASEIVNYSALAKTDGLILHTTVGIGYETPWRQVEAMLLEAAARTPGLLREPKPFVLQTALGDFAVTYQINAYCGEARGMFRVYSALHANILDAFNEYGVQIMTPAYEGDPAEPKVVPRDKWHLPPASTP